MGSRVLLLVACLGLLAGACSSDSGGSAGSGEAADADVASADGSEGEGADGTSSTTAPAVPPIVIGAVMAETGLMAPIDAPALAAATDQVEAINAAGGLLGRPLQLRVVDSESQFNGAFQAAESLLNDNAALLLLTCDYDFARPALEAGAEAETLMISPCSGDARWSEVQSPLAFSMATPAVAEGGVLGRYALDSGARTAAVLIDQTSPETIGQCNGFRDAFQFGGGQVVLSLDFDFGFLDVFTDDIPENEPDLAPLGTVDVIALCTAPPDLGPGAIRVIRDQGYQAPILSGSTMGGDTWIVDVPNLGDFWSVTYAVTGGGDPSLEVDQLFARLGETDRSFVRNGRPVTGADAVAAFAAAVTATGSLEGPALASHLETFTDEPLISGPISFGPDSHVSVGRSLRIVREMDGRLVYLESRPAL